MLFTPYVSLLITKLSVSLKMNTMKARKRRLGGGLQGKWCDEWEDKMKKEEMKKKQGMVTGEG